MINRECFEKSLASYKAAFDRLFDICPFMDLHGSGHTIIDAMRGNIQVGHGCDDAKFVANATAIEASHRELFNFSDPKPIDRGYHEWRAYFFTVTFIIQSPYEVFGWEFARVDADGNITEAHCEPRKYFLCLHSRSRDFGVKDWEKRRAERESLADAADVTVRDEYIKACKFADREVERWLVAINERPQVSLEKS